MNIRKTVCAAAVFGCVAAATAADEVAEAEKGEILKEETPIVSAEFGLQLDSKYMTYGVVDGKDPILTPSAQLTFFDWAYVGVESIFDLTKGNGKRGDYGNRAGKWTTLDAIVGLSHEFELTDGIGLSVDFNYIYEYLRRHRYHNTSGADKDMGDTQYLNLELGLTGFWLEPTLGIERDLMASRSDTPSRSSATTKTRRSPSGRQSDRASATSTGRVAMSLPTTTADLWTRRSRASSSGRSATTSRSRPTSPTATTGSTRSSAMARVPTTARGARAATIRGPSTAALA